MKIPAPKKIVEGLELPEEALVKIFRLNFSGISEHGVKYVDISGLIELTDYEDIDKHSYLTESPITVKIQYEKDIDLTGRISVTDYVLKKWVSIFERVKYCSYNVEKNWIKLHIARIYK